MWSLFVTTLKLSVMAGWSFAFLWLFRLFVYWPRRSRLSRLPGPEPVGGVFGGHLRHLADPDLSPEYHEELRKKYGLNMRFYGMGYFDERFLTFDKTAIDFILGKAADLFPKPWQAKRLLTRIIGRGLFCVDGDEHRKQRKIIMPAFANNCLRALQPLYFEKSHQLLEAVTQAHDAEVSRTERKTGAVLDMDDWFRRTTFDVVGLALFNYSFDALKHQTNEMYCAYRELFDAGGRQSVGIKGVLGVWFPWISRLFPDEAGKIINRSQATILRIGGEILKKHKVELEEHGGKMLNQGNSKDILSLLIKSNAAEEDPANRMTDQELLTQIDTLIYVGSDTTSLCLDWTFHCLSQNQDFQDRLREELKAIPADDPSDPSYQNAIMSLPFLDQVIKESLRLIPPLHSTIRVAAEDCMIPTSDGTEVFIRKGQFVHVAVEGFNTRKDVWGPDSFKYNPDRWAVGDPYREKALVQTPGVVAGLMTFLNGPHGCPGYQFAIFEVKAVLATLIPALVFEPAPGIKIGANNAVVTRPFVRGQGYACRLPLSVRPYQA